MKRFFLYILITSTLQNCNKVEFAEQKKIEEFKATDFVISLEKEFPINKNTIYASSMLYAWNALNFKKIENDKSSDDFHHITTSKSYINSLKEDEINIEAGRSDSLLYAKAYFKKNLPFEKELDENPEPINFITQKVKSFGFYGSDYEKSKQSEIIYYKNDNNFIIKLFPKDTEHEILIAMLNDEKYNNFESILKSISQKKLIGSVEKKNKNTNWKYFYNDGDIVKIPIINFNILKNFKTLNGQSFREKNKNFTIEQASQQIAFILNNKGAKVESEAELEIAIEALEEDLPKPKKLVFNKPFAIFLKRKNSRHPYFACYIKNIELLTKD